MPKKSDKTKQRIIEAANQLFYHKGYYQTSFSDVVDAANVPRGNIYYYFKTKDQILQAAINYRLVRIQQMLDNWSGEYRTPVERLHRFLDILDNSADSLSRFGCPMGSLNMELGKEQLENQAHAAKLFRVFEHWLSDQFSELGYAGRAHELAMRLIAFGQGISMLTHVHKDPNFARREKNRLADWIEQLADGNDDCA